MLEKEKLINKLLEMIKTKNEDVVKSLDTKPDYNMGKLDILTEIYSVLQQEKHLIF